MDKAHAKNHFPYLYIYLTIYVIALFLTGCVLDDFPNIIKGLKAIVLTEDSLITDYVRVAGPGAALVNSALVTSIALVLLFLSHESHNGMTLLLVSTILGIGTESS